MLEIAALLCLLGALGILMTLSAIDLRERLLPNELVMGFAALGLVFHISTMFSFSTLADSLLGCLTGGGFLYLIRTVANIYYEEDALGLGDVKLLAAAGIWLGPTHTLIAMTAGAMAGILHGLYIVLRSHIKAKIKMDFNKLSLPAGPGFILGIITVASFKFRTFPDILIPELLNLMNLQ